MDIYDENLKCISKSGEITIHIQKIAELEAERDKLRAEVERHIFERERLKEQHEYVVKQLRKKAQQR